MQAKLFYSRFSASVVSQVTCPHAEICRTKTVEGPILPPVIQTPTLFVGGGGATVEQLWENYKSFTCSPSAEKCSACSKREIPTPFLSNRQAWVNLPDVFILAIGRAQASPTTFPLAGSLLCKGFDCVVKVCVLQSAH